MNEKIVRFKLTWHNWGLIGPNSVHKEEVVLHRNSSNLIYKKLAGGKRVLLNAKVDVESYYINKFFDFLDSIYNDWETDYSVPVCDGSAWDIKLTDLARNNIQIRGTLEYPPHGEQIETFIRQFIDDALCEIQPRLFGCR